MNDENRVSVILLTYNGESFLETKIETLIKEIYNIPNSELIIIDDGSIDNSQKIIQKYKEVNNVIIILKGENSGIPNSINYAAKISKGDILVFCDQRQELDNGVLSNLIDSLITSKYGAVSACISGYGKSKKCSLLRKHENMLKTLESKSGNLIGVYGPLYAIKKTNFSPLPEDIILDDLYASLQLLKSTKLKMVNECKIYDDDLEVLYNYKRSKRYLKGYLQILVNNKLLKGIGMKNWIMLFFHKYIRLIFPHFLALSYLGVAYLSKDSILYLILFILFSTIGIFSLTPGNKSFICRIKNPFRVMIFYFLAPFDILFEKLFRLKEKRNKLYE